ncbi:MAG: hypothetical protein HW416_3798 [Chloroflexi bacterium]|nr:hypothetical protein [Chloroflexota bacterium]
MAVSQKIEVETVDEKEGLRILDEAAQRYLHISGEEFLIAWDAGKYHEDTPEIMCVAMLIHLAR